MTVHLPERNPRIVPSAVERIRVARFFFLSHRRDFVLLKRILRVFVARHPVAFVTGHHPSHPGNRPVLLVRAELGFELGFSLSSVGGSVGAFSLNTSLVHPIASQKVIAQIDFVPIRLVDTRALEVLG
jgi:hypothetical protein